MSKRKSDIPIESWFLTEDEVAKLFGRGLTHFKKIYPKLQEQGFPQADDIFGGWYIRAIQNWCDRRYGLEGPVDTDEDLFLKNARGWHGNDQSGLPSN